MMKQTLEIWSKDEYKGRMEDGFSPTLETYILKGEQKRGAVLILPGGGYEFTSEREAEPVALQFNAAGFHAFVLYYSVAPRKHPQPLMDVSKAVRMIREHAEQWNVNRDAIAVCGFSAGGHLAASLGVHWNKSYLTNDQGFQNGMNQPNALILGYPVITSGEFAHRGSFHHLLGPGASEELLHEMSLEHHINKETPPAFLWHTFDDGAVPVENTLLFVSGLRKQGIPFELHIFPEGPHGMSLATELTSEYEAQTDPHVAVWVPMCIQWLRKLFV